MRHFKKALFLSVLLYVSSCVRTGIMKDVPVTLVRPDKVLSVSADTTFECTFPEVLHSFGIQIVNDTILVLQEQVSENNPYHFKAYSTNTFEYLGSFVRNGRGPGEMISPHIARCNTSDRYLSISDNAIGEAYLVDVPSSIITGRGLFIESYQLPSGIIDWLSIPDSGQFLLQQENEEMIFRIIGSGDYDKEIIRPYEGIDGNRCLTYFSSLFVNNGASGEVAEVMMFFPQINIIDTKSGELFSMAVDNSYRKWKQVLASIITMDTKEYYSGATATSEYIIAAYRHLPLKSMSESGHGTSIHVFDWDGNFLFDIKVSEDIGNITYDCIHKSLYCMDMDGGIIRYDLSAIL